MASVIWPSVLMLFSQVEGCGFVPWTDHTKYFIMILAFEIRSKAESGHFSVSITEKWSIYEIKINPHNFFPIKPAILLLKLKLYSCVCVVLSDENINLHSN